MPRPKSTAGAFVELVAIVAFAIGLALLIQAYVVKPYQIPSGSMIPTLEIGQRVLVNRIGYHFGDPSIGDIVVFHPPLGADGPGPTCGASEEPRAALPEARSTRSRTRTSSSGSSPGPATRSASATATRSSTASRPTRTSSDAVSRQRRRLQPAEDDHDSTRSLLHDGRQPWIQRRQPLLGTRPQGLDHRQGLCHLLAPRSNRHLLSRAGAGRSAAAKPKRRRKRPDGRRTAWLFRFDQNFGCRYVAGADEAGRGCLAGPLVAAGVLLDYEKLGPERAQDAGRARRLEAEDRGGARGALPGRPRLRRARRRHRPLRRRASTRAGCT